MARTRWTKEQRQIIQDQVTEWQKDSKKPRREELLTRLYTTLGGGDANALSERQREVRLYFPVPAMQSLAEK